LGCDNIAFSERYTQLFTGNGSKYRGEEAEQASYMTREKEELAS
jgi:hypothetical protein